MTFNKFLDKAKEAASKAKDASLEAAAKAKESLPDAVSKAKDASTEAVAKAKENLPDTLAKAKDVSREAASSAMDTTEKLWGAGKDKMQELLPALLEEFQGLKPILADCGFFVYDLEFAIAIPPQFTIYVNHTSKGKKTLEQILEEDKQANQLTKLQRMALTTLLKANDLSVVTSKYGYRFGQYELVLTLPPQLKIHLLQNEA
jgi:vacuolar-type H+-ATPase subunit H